MRSDQETGLVEESKKQDSSRGSELDGVLSFESDIPLSEPPQVSSLDSKIADKIQLINQLELRIADKDDDFERYESLGLTEAENNEWRKRQETIQARNILRSELILLQEEKINNEIINSSLSSIISGNQLKEELLYLSLNTPEIEVEEQFKKKIFLDAIEDLLNSQIEVINKKIIAIQNRLLTLTSCEPVS